MHFPMPKDVCQKIVAVGINRHIAISSVRDRMRLPKCFSMIRYENVREVSRTDRAVFVYQDPSISREHPLVMRESFPLLLFILLVWSLVVCFYTGAPPP